jgi:hypothetical protein
MQLKSGVVVRLHMRARIFIKLPHFFDPVNPQAFVPGRGFTGSKRRFAYQFYAP